MPKPSWVDHEPRATRSLSKNPPGHPSWESSGGSAHGRHHNECAPLTGPSLMIRSRGLFLGEEMVRTAMPVTLEDLGCLSTMSADWLMGTTIKLVAIKNRESVEHRMGLLLPTTKAEGCCCGHPVREGEPRTQALRLIVAATISLSSLPSIKINDRSRTSVAREGEKTRSSQRPVPRTGHVQNASRLATKVCGGNSHISLETWRGLP